MGLAAPKRRSRLSYDPNNTQWSNSANSYGQRILSAQGWKQGDYLGARDASHAGHYTAANKAHIKILLREDNLGLGAQVGKSNAETFGLSLYSGVLSRLNGKSDAEVESQQSALRDAELRTYQANKHGFINFVSGGVLVGDVVKREESHERDAGVTDAARYGAKRRKLDFPPQAHGHARLAALASGHDAVEMPLQDANVEEPDLESTLVETEATAGVAKKKREKKHKPSVDEEQTSAVPELDKQTRKLHKLARKEERRKRKEAKRESRAEKRARVTKPARQPHLSDDIRTQTSSSPVNGSRHAVRHRYIRQKRMAALDPQAMREIFMVKAGA